MSSGGCLGRKDRPMKEVLDFLSKPWVKGVALLALASGIFQAFYNSIDNYILQNIFTYKKDALIGPLIYIIIGAWLGLFMFFLIGLLSGKSLEKKFKKYQKPDKKTLVFALGAGLFSAVATLFNLVALSKYDVGLFITLSTGTVIFISLIDVLRKNVSFRMVAVPTFLIVLGTTLSVSKTVGGFNITWEAVFLVFILYSISDAVSENFSKTGNELTDPINFLILRFTFLTLFGTLFSIGIVVWLGKIDTVMEVLTSGILKAVPYIGITMIFVYFSFVCRYKAFRGDELSIIELLTYAKIFVGLMITFLFNALRPGIFGTIETDFFSVSLRVLGGMVVFLGVAYLAYLVFRKERDNVEKAESVKLRILEESAVS